MQDQDNIVDDQLEVRSLSALLQDKYFQEFQDRTKEIVKSIELSRYYSFLQEGY